ncbi:MAG: DUF1449 family protein [Deltaproteobacteria bacterium]|nr:DUF1449 family protein [Deltaproteobacteria bacterium]
MSVFFASLFAWANIPYTTALVVVILYVLLQIIGLLPFGEHDADSDADADADADGDGDGDAESDNDHDHDADEGGRPAFPSILGTLGVGKVPLSIIWQSLLASFGLTGITLTTLVGGYGTWMLLWTVPVSLVVSFFATGTVARVLAKIVPATSGEASSRRDLVGCTGVVISRSISSEFGEARLTDGHGRVLRLICYTHDGESAIPEGTEIVIMGWDGERDRLFVAPLGNLLEGKKK